MKPQLRFETAVGALALVSDARYPDYMQSLGVSPADYKLLTGNTIFVNADRQVVTNALNAFCSGVLDLVGVARFELPAEYIAAVINAFVRGPNIMVACNWMADLQPRPGDELVADARSGLRVTAPMLFTLICRMRADNRCEEIKHAFEKHMKVPSGAEREK